MGACDEPDHATTFQRQRLDRRLIKARPEDA
jgi:hypothetical protein